MKTNRPAGQNAFAAFEAEKDRENMSHRTAKAGDVCAILNQFPGANPLNRGECRHIGKQLTADKNGQNAFCKIKNEGTDGGLRADGAENVGGARISASHGSDILLMRKKLRENDGEADASQQIRDYTS